MIQRIESDCNFFRLFIKAQIIAKGTEHPSYHRVELLDKVEILSFTPYFDREYVCLLCKLQGGAIVSIPTEWLQIMEEE